MATTYIDFVPSKVLAPTFNVTLDSNIYAVTVEWNIFSQRYYIKITSLTGDVVLYEALVGSPIGINMAAISWANGKVTVTTADPHFLRIGQTLNLTITGVTPTAYNGVVEVFVTGRDTFTYMLAAEPDAASVLGSVQQNLNLVEGLFSTTLVYRQSNSQFEVT